MTVHTSSASPEALFLDHLRTHTAAAHKRLEQLPVSISIIQPSVTGEHYGTYLQAMYDVVKSLEMEVFPKIKTVIADLDDRLKSKHIENDLAHIGFSSLPQTTTAVFDGSKMSIPFALGVAYVVEGSTLGGRFILKNVQSALGFDEHAGATYFAGYGNKTGSRWKAFLDALTTYAIAHSCTDEIAEGARFAFEKIYEHLGRVR